MPWLGPVLSSVDFVVIISRTILCPADLPQTRKTQVPGPGLQHANHPSSIIFVNVDDRQQVVILRQKFRRHSSVLADWRAEGETHLALLSNRIFG